MYTCIFILIAMYLVLTSSVILYKTLNTLYILRISVHTYEGIMKHTYSRNLRRTGSKGLELYIQI